MQLALLNHPSCAQHDLGPWHPEQPKRIAAIENELEREGLSGKLLQLEARLAKRAELERIHPANYLDTLINAVPDSGINWLDPDTGVGPHSWQAALHAAGSGIQAVDDILSGKYQRAFCNVRPPGHHAETGRAMGFCLLNNIAIAAAHALVQSDIAKVAIVDFDVHHGNGTEQIFQGNEQVLLISSFQHPYYPHCGTVAHAGFMPLPLAAGSSGKEFRAAWQGKGLPLLAEFGPDFILLSAGFDGHRDDPLASLNLVEGDYSWLTQEVCRIADESAQGRVVSMLEGGYDLAALGRSAAAHIKALMND